jgi:hypothetical protein
MDFLFDYGHMRFGREWVEGQGGLPREQLHPLMLWRKQAYEYVQTHPIGPDGAIDATGALTACNNFYYDMYTVDDNSLLDDDLLSRLRNRDQFQGAMHELFAQATCLRAGFTVIRENEKDRHRKHVEFVAVHKLTGQHVLVEAKSRHRAGVMAQPGTITISPDMKFRRLINEAVKKDPNNPLAIFVETNLPAKNADLFYEPRSTNPLIPSRASAALMEAVRKDYGGVDPYNLLIFSNHPPHYSGTYELAQPGRWMGIVSQRPRVRVLHDRALFDLLNAANLYGNVPTHFPKVDAVSNAS